MAAPPELLSVHGSGTWLDEGDGDRGVVRAWVDARVADRRYEKRVFADVLAPYADGQTMRVLAPMSYRESLEAGHERWGTDAVEIYPDGGPNGASLVGPVLVRLRIQADLDGDGTYEMAVTGWERLYGDGEIAVPVDDPWAPGIDSPVASSGQETPERELWLAPFDDPGREVVRRIDEVIARASAAPDARHTIHAAVYNIDDPEIVSRLVAAHEAGVEVRLIMDGRKLRPWYDWYTGDDRLLAAGVPLLGVVREETGAMHTKIALFDGEAVATGSFNWEHGARFENHENMLVTDERPLVAAYARRFEALAGGVEPPRAFATDPAGEASVSFAPDEAPHRVVGRLIDDAERSIEVAMFTAKDVVYREGGRETSLLRKLVAAHERGVRVTVVIDHGVHEASEFHGIVTDDDPIDEWLEDQGVRVVRADNDFGRYASMHHKLVVIDGSIAVTGAFNWYHDAAYRNDEDQLVLRDPCVAARLQGEVVDLLRRYDPGFDPDAWPQVDLDIEVFHDRTFWGQGVRLVGDLPALGAWDPAGGVALSAEAWPLWRGSVRLPRGVRFWYKLVTTDGSHEQWEPGPDRLFTVPGCADRAVLEARVRPGR